MKVLIIGYGSIARKHHTALIDSLPSVDITALRSSNYSKAVHNVRSVFSIQEAELFSPYDFIIISNPTYLHQATIQEVLDFNCPLFIEKPLSNNLSIGSLIGTINSRNILTYVACNLRFLDSLIYLKNEIIKSERINEVNIYCGSYLPSWRPNSDYKLNYSANAEMGGGVHLDLIHEIDYTYWLFGLPKEITSVKRTVSSLGIKSIDYANYILDYDSFSVSIILNYYRPEKRRTIELVCNNNIYWIDLNNNTIHSNGNLIFNSPQKIEDTYNRQMKYFINAVRNHSNGAATFNNISEAFEVLNICLK